MDKLICANEGCEIEFTPRIHNNKYHNDECCRLATNRRQMEKYYEGRARLLGEARFCTVCEATRLNRYNDTNVCASCTAKRQEQANREVFSMLTSAQLSW